MDSVNCLAQAYGTGHSQAAWETFKCVAQNYPNEIQLAQTLFSVVFGLGGFSFGVWRAWRYRERLLFERLKSFLNDDAAEIEDATQEVFTRIIRPSIATPGLTSFDALWSLTKLRNRRKFTPLLAFAATKTAAQQYLESSADTLERTQREFARYHLLALRRALSARLLCSVIDASTAAETQNTQEKGIHTQLAHEHVRLARRLPDCSYDPKAIEIEINLLLAEERYHEAGTLAQTMIEPRPTVFYEDNRSSMERALSVGRAHKYQALDNIAADHPVLAANSLNLALARFRDHPHVRDSNLLDFAQITELRAACAKRNQAPRQQRYFMKLAEICYAKLRDTSAPWNRGLAPWMLSKVGGDKFHRYLQDAAIAGLARIQSLRVNASYFPPPFQQVPPDSP